MHGCLSAVITITIKGLCVHIKIPISSAVVCVFDCVSADVCVYLCERVWLCVCWCVCVSLRACLIVCLLMCESLGVTPLEMMLYKEARVKLKQGFMERRKSRTGKFVFFLSLTNETQTLPLPSSVTVTVATSPPHPCLLSPRRPESKDWNPSAPVSFSSLLFPLKIQLSVASWFHFKGVSREVLQRLL